MKETAWAIVKDDGKIDIGTVFEHRRGAMANWLVRTGFFVDNEDRDEDIERKFQYWAAKLNVSLRRVSIELEEPSE